jgi:hypothetical protein
MIVAILVYYRMYKFGLQHQRRPERNRNRALQNGAALGLGLGAITRAGLSGSPVMRAALSYARLSQLATLLVGGPAAVTDADDRLHAWALRTWERGLRGRCW